MKDVEKLGSKAGVVQQTIKDVLASLVDDSLVEMDKIGATNWYWSFPSQQISKRIGLISTLEARQKMRASEARLRLPFGASAKQFR